MTARLLSGGVAYLGLLLGCSGADAEPEQTPIRTAPAAAVSQEQVADTTEAQGETELLREVFTFQGSGRDPFLSLLESGDVRPLAEDLRITSITYDPRYPAASVAVLRDTVVNQAYAVRVGDELGRLRVVGISPGEVILVLSEFGSERQVVLRQRRRQEGTP
ncbi:MAG: hypothetical protein JSW51_03745 [Gemmatimonadota bacterium]|nr:MAG: hypothetical protein JSW51_03745 [Gemmatimonadota bacterium]